MQTTTRPPFRRGAVTRQKRCAIFHLNRHGARKVGVGCHAAREPILEAPTTCEARICPRQRHKIPKALSRNLRRRRKTEEFRVALVADGEPVVLVVKRERVGAERHRIFEARLCVTRGGHVRLHTAIQPPACVRRALISTMRPVGQMNIERPIFAVAQLCAAARDKSLDAACIGGRDFPGPRLPAG